MLPHAVTQLLKQAARYNMVNGRKMELAYYYLRVFRTTKGQEMAQSVINTLKAAQELYDAFVQDPTADTFTKFLEEGYVVADKSYVSLIDMDENDINFKREELEAVQEEVDKQAAGIDLTLFLAVSDLNRVKTERANNIVVDVITRWNFAKELYEAFVRNPATYKLEEFTNAVAKARQVSSNLTGIVKKDIEWQREEAAIAAAEQRAAKAKAGSAAMDESE